MHKRPGLGHLFILVASASLAHADAGDEGPRVHRCIGRHGEVVFTNLACDSHELAGVSVGAMGGANPAAAPPADSCPLSELDLRERVAAAVARHDANTIAGMMHWRGIGGRAANERLRVLRDLVRQPLLTIEGGSGLRVRTGSNTAGGVREHAFGIEFDGVCWWLSW